MDIKIEKLVEIALSEDSYNNDITSNTLIDKNHIISGNFISRSSGVVSGINVVNQVFKRTSNKLEFVILKKDGSFVNKGDVIAYVKGPSRDILRSVQTAINFLQKLSGIASITNKFVQEIKGTKCNILDTRNNTPLYKELEKKAVRDGGGLNSRTSLNDYFVITTNHIAIIGDIKYAVELAKMKAQMYDKLTIEVEVENKNEYLEALETEADFITLVNMNLDEIKELVKLNNKKKKLAVKGNITLTKVRSYALTGVDYIYIDILNNYKNLEIDFKFYKRLKK